jgi:hypothetical protein
MISYKKFSLNAYEHARGFSVLKNMSMFADTILNCCWSPEIWKDGVRLKENFIASYFLVLDFDEPGDETMHEINNAFCDHKRIIATTKSHQKEKNGVVCDRFRLVIPWDKPVTELSLYLHNMQCAYKRFPWADRACLTAGRFYYPSKKIIYIDRESEYCWETSDTLPTLHTHAPTHYTHTPPDGQIPYWCLNFINNGAVFNGSRNMKIFSVARELFRQGFVERDVRKFIMLAPIDWNGISLESILKSAKKKEMK